MPVRHFGPARRSSTLHSFVRTAAAAILLLLAAATSSIAQRDTTRTEPLRLMGVFDATSGDWLERAVLRDTLGNETTTSRFGVAALNFLTPIAGFYLIEVRKEGYAPRRVRLRADTTFELMIALERNALGDATRLPAIVTTEKRRLAEDPGLRSGFFERCQMKGVSCVGRAALDKRPTAYLAQLLSQVDGVHRDCAQRRRGLVFNPAKKPDFEPERIEGCRIEMRSTAGDYCTPTFIVNGFEWYPLGGSAQAQIDQFLPPNRMEGIEIYPANGPHPQKFDSGPFSGCGTIVIWTR